MKRVAFAILLLLPACTPKLDQAEVADMLLKPGRGLVGGIELGDSWDELKAHHDPRYTLGREWGSWGEEFRELRRDLSWKPDRNGFFLSFSLDAQHKIARYSVAIYGEKRNFAAVRALRDAFIARLNEKLGPGRCADKDDSGRRIVFNEPRYCNWPPANGKPAVSLSYEEDDKSAEIDASINPIPPGEQREHCPCGCDHSEAMADDLRAQPPDAALAVIARKLGIIAEREDAGFITEAMVRHRLRLLDLRTELEPQGAPAGVGALGGYGDRGVPLPPERQREARALLLEDASLRVQMELVTHGQTTGIVEGREKVTPASFRLWMEIENLTDAQLALTAPTIESSVGSPISRWYVLGGDGRPWDGTLRAREKTAVNAIGYLGQQVEPGTEMEATIRFHSLLGRVSARARRRWDRPE